MGLESRRNGSPADQREQRIEQQLLERNVELEVINAVSIAVTESLELETILERTLDAVLRVSGLAPSGGIFLLDEELGELRLVSHRGLRPDFVENEQRVKVGECLCGLAAATGELIGSPDSCADPRHTRCREGCSHSHIVVPLAAHERVRGVMFLYPPVGHELDASQRRLFSTIGRQIGVAIEHALVYQSTGAELRRKVVELGTALQEAERQRTRASEVQRLKDDYVTMVSHDLRTPLSGILAQAELARRRAERNGNTSCAEAAEAIIRGGQRMNSMITDLVESARLESGQVSLDIEVVSATTLVSDVLDMLPAADRQRVDQELPEALPLVRADRQRIGRVVTNLVTNALKYSPTEARVLVRLTGDDSEVVVSVEDRGIGIDATALPRVFERFYRACGVTGPDGLGLGLYITRLLVEAHGGRITAESVKGEGSTFRFTLPVATAR